ncbi:hypothetical protein TCT1_07920 [Xenorhabdus sp. TCT-1]|uniref:Uncharacterized protein n=1 Tax=Xenorhabdus taiwanensis TaxID=3085177 RepID=A0ABN7C022_9GAMM|nr:hypothetical protein TCT1_07920 [Xenorhabdus sp. TCT-1]
MNGLFINFYFAFLFFIEQLSFPVDFQAMSYQQGNVSLEQEISPKSQLTSNILQVNFVHYLGLAEKWVFLALINLLGIVSNTWLSIAQITSGNYSLFAQDHL